MLLIVAYGAAIGGIGTPVGSPPNLTAISALAKHGVSISFFRWMSICVPLLAVMTVVQYALLWWLHRDQSASHADPHELEQFLQEQRRSLGNWTAGQRNTAFAFGLAITLWIIPGVLDLVRPELGEAFKQRVPESIAALVAALLLFVMPTGRTRDNDETQFTITWDEAAKIDWGTILLFGGGLTLGSLMDSTGVASVLGKTLINATGVDSLWGLTAMAIVVGLILSETSSNTAAANMVIPIVIGLAKEAKVNVVPPVLGACLGASYGFMLPVSTPPNAIVYGTGLVPITRMIRAGILFDLLGAVLIYVGLRVVCPWLGIT